MMHPTSASLVVLSALSLCFLACCARISPPPPQQGYSRDFGADLARSFADRFVADIVRQSDQAYDKMDVEYTSSIGTNEFRQELGTMLQTYGNLLSCEYRAIDTMSAPNIEPPVHKVWYACRTTKYEVGSHFLYVELRSAEKPSVVAFGLVNFPNGPPPRLTK